MIFRKRGFQELVDDILTELTGGIVNEPIQFTTSNGEPTFLLENTPVARIASVTGTVAGDFHQFKDSDFELTSDGTSIRWIGTTVPDDGSVFLVDYYPEAAQSPVTDRNVGSVARTLVESVGRELAVLYEQMDLVYRSGFLELAEGTSLDFVVALLGLQRIRAGRQVGEVVFTRSTPAPGDITIPQGTVVATPPQGDEQVVFEYETTTTRTMRQGQTEVTAPIRFTPTPAQQADFVTGQVPANAISLIPKPIVGIETVTNPEPTTRGAEDETDEQLRQRAKKALAEAGKSTVDALRAAVLQHGPGVNVVVQDLPRGVPGEVALVIDGADDPQRRADIFQSVLETKAAGVMITDNYSERVEVALALRLETQDDVQLSGDEQRRIESTVRTAIVNHISRLKAGEDVARNALVALSLSDARLRNVTIETLSTTREGLPEDTGTRLRDAAGTAATLTTFDHVRIGQFEKAATTEEDVTIKVELGEAEVTTAVRITVTLVGNRTPAGEDVEVPAIQPQIETLVRGFAESPDRGGEIKLAQLIDFVQGSSGLFTVKPHPDSFLVAEHLGTGQVDREVDVVQIGEKERAELDSLILELT